MSLHVTPITQNPAYLVKVAPNSYLPFPAFGLAEMAAQKLKLESSKIVPVFEGWVQAEFQITDKYWAELSGGKPYVEFNQTPRPITGLDVYPGCTALMLQIEVKNHQGQLKQWDCLDIRGKFVDPLSKQEVETRKAILADSQYVVIDQWSKALTVHNLPEVPGHISRREAKRAMRQIEKLLSKGDGSMDYYSEWALQNGQNAPLGILAFGSGLDDKHNKRAPENARYGFSSWLWKVAEALGYECTDMDQTSRCDDCDGAVDTGSSTPDYYSIIEECSIVCGKCLNNGNIADGINGSSFGYLSWKPEPARTDAYMLSIYGNLIEIVFDNDLSMERFQKDHLLSPNECWKRIEGWHTRAHLWFRHDNLKNESLAQYGKPDEWAVYRAHIEWPSRSRWEDCPVRGFWDFVEREVDEQRYPLLWYLAKGKIEEGLLFYCEIELLESLLNDWNESRVSSMKLNDLRHAELQYSEIEEIN